MVQLWFSYGSAMAQLWLTYGSAMAQLWLSYGSAMALKFLAVSQPRIFGHTLLQKVRQADNVLVRR